MMIKELFEGEKMNDFFTEKEDCLENISEDIKFFFSISDNINKKNYKLEMGSKILENYTPPFDAKIINYLEKKGGFFIGKTKITEFGIEDFSNKIEKKDEYNEFKEFYVGGCFGSAASVNILKNYLSFCSSNGEGVIVPSIFYGVYGMVLTKNLISNDGFVEISETLDRTGIMIKNISSLEKHLKEIVLADEKFFEKKNSLKIAIPKKFPIEVDEKIKEQFFHIVEEVKKEGVEIEYIEMDVFNLSSESFFVIDSAEKSISLAKYCGLLFGYKEDFLENNFSEYYSKIRGFFSLEMKKRLIWWYYLKMKGKSQEYYKKAMEIRRKIKNEYKKIFTKYDLVLTPSLPKIGGWSKKENAENFKMNKFYIPSCLTGFPSITVPLNKEGDCKNSLYFVSDEYNEGKLIFISKMIEKIIG